jgi:ribosome recycling factor
MNEEVQMYLDDTQENMQKAVKHLESELVKLRAGKANPHLLSGIQVDYYGTRTPLHQVANIGTTDAQTIVIQPWEKSMIEVIEKEIMKANLGFNPSNNGDFIRINVPTLTEERRKALVKQVKTEGENAKVSVRTARREGLEEIKKLQKDGLPEDEAKHAEDLIQKMTDDFSKKIDTVIDTKEKDIMTV